MALRTDSVPSEVKKEIPKGETRVNDKGQGFFYEYKIGRDDKIIAELNGEKPKEVKAVKEEPNRIPKRRKARK